MLERVNWVALVSPLFLDIQNTRPEVATHGELERGRGNVLRKHCMGSLLPTPSYLSSLRWHK